MSVFDRDAFANPLNRFRPLQIVHGLDRFLAGPVEERDPAGEWAERLAEAPSASDNGG